MTQFQKITRNCAIGIAAFIIMVIINSLGLALNVFSGVLGLRTSDEYELERVNIESGTITNLSIDLASTKLELVTSDEFKIETNNSKIKVVEQNNKLEIKEKQNFINNSFKSNKLVVYLPNEVVLDVLSIDSGAGEILIENLSVNKLDLDIGAGNVNIDKLTVNNSSDISGGTGSLAIKDGKINNLNLEVGVGSTDINLVLTGYNEIEAGVGKLNLNLLDSIDNYKINLEKGIGAIKLNDANVNNNTYGTGNNTIKVEAGIGSIEITTK